MALGVFGEIRPPPVRQFHPLIHLSCPPKYLTHKCYSEVLWPKPRLTTQSDFHEVRSFIAFSEARVDVSILPVFKPVYASSSGFLNLLTI
jgi:hypothetical protein